MSFGKTDNLVFEGEGTLSGRIREKLKEYISTHELGTRLPPERQLSQELNVSNVTIRRAMLDLAAEGYIVRFPGRGTFIRKTFNVGADTTNLSQTIGLVIPDIDIPYHASLLNGIEAAASANGYAVTVCNMLLDHSGSEPELLERLAKLDLAGLLAVPIHDDSLSPSYRNLIQRLQSQGINVVLIDEYVAGLQTPVAMVDKVSLGYLATEHLIMLGHRKIAYASTASYDTSGSDSLSGYRMALDDYDVMFDESLLINLPVQKCAGPAHDAVIKMLTENPRAFSAIATPQFSMTYGIMKALEELCKKVPGEIALVGNDAFYNPDLAHITHTRQPIEQVGFEAVNLLLKKNGQQRKQHVLLQPTLVIGDTCRVNN